MPSPTQNKDAVTAADIALTGLKAKVKMTDAELRAFESKMPSLCRDYEEQLAKVATEQLDGLQLARPPGDSSSSADLLTHHAEEMTGEPASVRRGESNRRKNQIDRGESNQGENQIGRGDSNLGENQIGRGDSNLGENHSSEGPSEGEEKPK